MAQMFEGRFYSLAGDGDYLANLSDYFNASYSIPDEDGVGGEIQGGDSPPSEDGRANVYGYAYGIGGKDRVVMLEARKATPGRAELMPMERFFGDDPGPVYGETWMTVEYYFPRGGFDRHEPVTQATIHTNDWDSNHAIIYQVFQRPEGSEPSHVPSFSFGTEQKHISIEFSYDTAETGTVAAPNISILQRKIVIPFNRWVRFGFHQKHAYDNNGFIHVYMDDFVIFSQTGTPNAHNNVLGPWAQFGLYKFFGNPVSHANVYDIVSSKAFLYTAGCTIWDDASTYEDVFGHADYGRPAARGMI